MQTSIPPPHNHRLSSKCCALHLGQRGYWERDVYMTLLLVDANWDALCREPRFVAVLRPMHFPASKDN